MPFTEESLLAGLPDLTRPARFWVAYSGGMDSHVLLVALQRLLARVPNRVSLHALHVDHGISPRAAQWQAHCQAVCAALGVTLRVCPVSLPELPGESLETRARQARYGVFEAVLEAGDVLVQAHHQDDQMETLLYRLCRGSGPQGLSGIPSRRGLGSGCLARPLLPFSRAQLKAYARSAGLSWIEDDSNADPRFDRNYLRLEVLPRIEARWPGFRETWSRAAGLCAETATLLDALADEDLQRASTGRANVLEAGPLAPLDGPRLRNLLRRWFATLGERNAIPRPDRHSLQRIVDEVLPAPPDALPCVSWRAGATAVEVRRYRGRLYALKALQPRPPGEVLEWPSGIMLALGDGLGALRLLPSGGGGFSLSETGPLQVRFRRGGERARMPGRPTRALKKILQESGVPPWLRDKLPLVYAKGELVAVGDLFVNAPWWRETGADLVGVVWERSDMHCGY